MAEVFLLISDHPEDPSFLAEVAAINGAVVQTMPDLNAAADFISKNTVAAVFLDLNPDGNLQKFEVALQKSLGMFNDKLKPAQVHLICDRSLDESRDNIQSPLFSNFYQRPQQDHEEAAKFYGRYLKAARNGSRSDLENFLGPRGGVQEVQLEHSDQKQEAAEEVRQYLIQGKVPSRISNIIANSVDELLMNGIFDAPVDEFGKHIYTSTERSQSRALTPRELTRMKIGFDGFYAGVTVTDQWGSIDRGRLLNHVSINYRDSDYTVKQGQAGAGLGLATIFQGGASLIYSCVPGKETRVTLLYRTYDNYRAFKNQFHFFSAKFNG
jgi:hypothetical protein